MQSSAKLSQAFLCLALKALQLSHRKPRKFFPYSGDAVGLPKQTLPGTIPSKAKTVTFGIIVEVNGMSCMLPESPSQAPII